MSIANYAEEAILNHLLRNVALASPATVYLGVALSGAAVDDELEAGNLASEVISYTGDRQAITFTAPAQNNGDGYVENTNLIEYDGLDATTVGYTFISDSPTKGAGNIIAWQPIVDSNGNPTTVSVEQDGILRLNAGSLRFRLR